MGLFLKISAHALHKAGTGLRLYEDAYAFDEVAGRAAVADGASDAFEAGAWARLLVTNCVQTPPPSEPRAFLEWLKAPTHAWRATLDWGQLPWYAEQKAREIGGLATLLGFFLEEPTSPPALEDAPTACWTALAIGDTCLLHVRKHDVLQRFPLDSAEGFGMTPSLVSSRVSHTRSVLNAGALRCYTGTCQVGDLFLLATDAMAHWLYGLADLADLKLGWECISSLIEEDFEALIQELRQQAVMRNDDVTLLVLRVSEHDVSF